MVHGSETFMTLKMKHVWNLIQNMKENANIKSRLILCRSISLYLKRRWSDW